MCGICGTIHFHRPQHAEQAATDISLVLQAMRHRGPDASDHFVEGPAALGANRLAIVDRSQHGAQPMFSHCGNLVLVFNGEIYNSGELRRDLESRGETFLGHCDSEVLLALYAHYGRACVHRLRGMFAFAIWNRREQRLFMARDRVGEKPFVYHHGDGVFAFASEIRGLVSLPWMPRRVDAAALHLGLHFVHVPPPFSAFRDIRKLEPGCCMEFDRKGLRVDHYWTCRFQQQTGLCRSLQDCAKDVADCLDETTRLLCHGDVPVGAILSGGLDSGAVVSAIPKSMQEVPTFRISAGPQANPHEYLSAEKIARRYGTRHLEIALPDSQMLTGKELAAAYGEPIGDLVSLDAHRLALHVKCEATVALTGNGGDELFGGYPDHCLLRALDHVLAGQNKAEDEAAEILPGEFQTREDLVRLPRGQVYAHLKYRPLDSLLHSLYLPSMRVASADCDPATLCQKVFDESGATTLFDGFMAQQLLLSSQYSLVDLTDVSGMSHSVEYRSPFLDVKMIELAMRIPAHFKAGVEGRGGTSKIVLREAMKTRLPPETMALGDKTGFGGTMPYKQWFWKTFGEEFGRRLQSPALADSGLFDMKRIAELHLLGMCGETTHTDVLWHLANIAAWLEYYF